MTSFKINKIIQRKEILAEELKIARSEKHLSLEKVAQAIGIKIDYLKAIEAGKFEDLPTGVFCRKYVKEYSLYLGMDQEHIKAYFEEEHGNNINSNNKLLFAQKAITSNAFIVPRMFKNVFILATVVVCFVYLFNNFEKLIKPPQLQIYTPAQDLVTKERTINISGKTETETQVVINGNQVISDKSGGFNQQISLRSGINTIIVTAKKKFGRENKLVKQILVKD
jgi:cytoskeletal protein RodZ